MNNIVDLIKMIKNPKEYAMSIVKQQNNPMLNNLVQMAEKGDTKGVENFARNMFKEKGEDFDKIMSNFK